MFVEDEVKSVFKVFSFILKASAISPLFFCRLLTGRKINTESDAFEVSAALFIVSYLDLVCNT